MPPVLSWLSARRVDHPMANLKRARQIVVELLEHDSFRVLDESANWLDSINSTEGFTLEHRIGLIDLLDRGCKYHAAKLSQEYLDASRLQKAYEARLWNASFGFSRALGLAYMRCIELCQAGSEDGKTARKDVALLSGRALHALGVQLKWLLLRYARVEDRIWRDLGRAYLFAEAQGLARQRTALYPGPHGVSSAQGEFARALLLAMSAPDGLSPISIHIAERVIAYLSEGFSVQDAPAAGCRFSFDLNMHRAPARIQEGRAGSMVRYFGPGASAGALPRLAEEIEQKDGVPGALSVGKKLQPPQIRTVIAHLGQYWSDRAPARTAPRAELATRITVVPGFMNILRWVEVVTDTSSLEFSNPESAESWIVFNTSDGGYGAIVPAMRGDWLTVGGVIGIRAETSDHCCVGVIRRLTRDQYNQRRVGIQMLGEIAVPVNLTAGEAKGISGTRPTQGLLLSRKPDRHGNIALLLRGGAYTDNRQVRMDVRQSFLLAPVALQESGDEYDWAQFRVVKQI